MTLEIPDIHALDAGIYAATLTDIEQKTTDAGTFRIWSFEVIADGKKEKITASSSLMLGPKSKAYKWVTALIGRSPVAGEKLEVIGLACQLHLIVDDDTGYNKVESVLPPANGARPAPVAAAPSVAVTSEKVAAEGDPSDPDWLPPLEEPPAHNPDGTPAD